MPFDIRQLITIPNNRTTGNIHLPCPNCQSSEANNPALSINLDTGAYHCFKCEGEKNGEIRAALGDRKDTIVPTALAQSPQQEKTVSPQEVKANHDKLINESRLAKNWLLERGFSEGAIAHYKLGVKRVKRLEKLWWSITIPIPADDLGTKYYQKLRIEPWVVGSDRPPQLQAWGQKGIAAQVWFTHLPSDATETYLCEGEWDAMMLGWLARQQRSRIAIATFTCGCDTVPPQSELDKLPGRVTIFYDRNDKPNPTTGERPGEKGARKVALALGQRGFIGEVPQRPEQLDVQGWDVSDAINAGFGMSDFIAASVEAVQPRVEKDKNPLRDRTVTNEQLMARAPDYIDWLVPDMLPIDELFVIAASPRAGKSLLAMCLAKSVALGDKFLGRPVTQGRVLYVNLEDSEAKIKQRQLAQVWERDLPIYWLDRFKLSDMDNLRALAEELDIRLIVLDTLSRIRDDTKQETSAEMSKVLEPLQQMANELKLAVLLIHHTTKITVENAGSTNVFDSIRGSSAIRAVARGSWILGANDRCYRLCVEHGFGEKQDLEVLLDPETLTWRVVRPWNPKSSATQVEQILEYLQKVKSATIPEIASTLNLNPNYVTTALWRLQVNNEIYKEPGKKFYPASYHILSSNNTEITYHDMQLIGNQDSPPVSISEDDISPIIKVGEPEKRYQKSDDTFSDISSDRHIRYVICNDTQSITESESQLPITLPINDQMICNKVSETGVFDTSGSDTLVSNRYHTTPNSDTFVSVSDTSLEGSQVDNKPKSNHARLKVGDRTQWIGGQGAMGVICKGKVLEVLEIRNDQANSARVKAPKWAVDYWVDANCLKRV